MQGGHESPPGRLRAVGLRKRFDATEAVSGVSLETRPGEFLTLLGGSGAGKSTLLRIFAGCIAADEGTVDLDGRRISPDAPPPEREIGVVFPDSRLEPGMTAAENVRATLEERGVRKPRLRDRVLRALAQVHLDGIGDSYPHQLSSGQRQRVTLARAIAFRPRLLLLDDPLAGLDKQLREALRAEIMRIQQELSVTVVHATQDQEEALVMSDRIAICRGGRIEQTGTGEDLYERPESVFVADLMGDANIIRGVFRRSAERGVLEAGALAVAVRGECANGAISDGDLAAVVIRPERMRLLAGAAGGPGMNSIPGIVRERIYVGAFSKYRVELHGGPLVTVTVPADADTAPPIGDAARVTWDPERSVLLRDEPLRAPAPSSTHDRTLTAS